MGNKSIKTAEEMVRNAAEDKTDAKGFFPPEMVIVGMKAYHKQFECQPANKWVKIEDELPSNGTLVLFLVNDIDVYIGMLHHGALQVWGAGRDPIIDMKVTRWQLLPDMPKDATPDDRSVATEAK